MRVSGRRRLTLAGASILLTFAAMVAAVSAQAAATSPASVSPRLTADTNAPCNTTPAPGSARCFAVIRTTTSHDIAASSTAGPPTGALSPADIQSAYNLPASGGAGQTVAIVDADGDSNAESDLAVYRTEYGLPACTTANGCFRKVNQTGGTTSYPSDDVGWGEETTLDLDAVSAACPLCHILLVEANSSGFSDLAAAEDEAVALGAKFISNSYGANEGAGETSYDSAYDHPGVAVVTAAGDTGNVVEWPSSDPDVTSVGGTELTQDSSAARGWTETAWSGGGSGCSTIEPKPAYQDGITTDCSMRATTDVSADADPATGLAIYDTLDNPGWLQVGGTSLATPLITSVYAMAGVPVAGTYPVNYPYHDQNQASDLFNVTQGSNGACGNVLCTAGPGWNGPTGLGTPDGVAAFSGGPQGVITGQLEDSATGKPIADAQVTASPGDYATTTDAEGDYTLDVAIGTYNVTGSTYAYKSATDTGVQATVDNTVTANLSLTELPHSVVSGTVRDGSGHGWPLYAQITIGGGYPGGPVYTNPFTGQYSVTLAGPASYPVQISAADPAIAGPADDGYQSLSVNIAAGTSAQTANFSLKINPAECAALGYGPSGLTENFSTWRGTTPRDGWTVAGTRAGWRFDDPGNRPPPTETSGSDTFAIADSGFSGGPLHTTLTSPAVNLSGQPKPQVTFQSGYYGGTGQQAQVDLSIDGGRHWQTIWRRTAGDAVGPVDIAIPQAANKQDVRVRFDYAGDNAWWWAVGDVAVGTPGCLPLPGGLVSGFVTAGGAPVDDATITSAADPDASAIATGASAGSSSFYSLFSPATGKQRFTAMAPGYADARATANVAAGQDTQLDWTLDPTGVSSDAGSAAVATSGAAGQAASPGQRSQPVMLPGLHGKSYTITLITGDQVRLVSDGSAGYSIEPASTTPGSPLVDITGSATPAGLTSLTAVPSSAMAMLASGQLNPGLFDLAWLVRHGDTGSAAMLHLVLSYTGRPGAAALARAAGALPGATADVVSAASGTVQVSLSAREAAAFWAAITTRGQLTGGISGIWLAGHQSAAAGPSASADQQLYTVTETITGQSLGAACDPGTSLCFVSNPILAGVSGEGAGTNWPASGISCQQEDSSGLCVTFQLTYNVPVGVYTGMGEAIFNQGVTQQTLDLTIPQITVAGDTSVTINRATEQQATVRTPRPSFAVSLATEDYRVAPDGTMVFQVVQQAYPDTRTWVVRAGQPVTVGTYDYSSNWIKDASTIAMTAAGGVSLTPVYPYYADTSASPFTEFSGRKTLQLVDAGIGSAADFAHIDARGKLAIITMNPAAGGCLVQSSQLSDAVAAGAAGVLIDPTLAASLGDGPYCPLPIFPDWFYPGADYLKPVNIPFAEIPQAQIDQLRSMMSGGTVSVTVTGTGNAAYQYDLAFYSEGGQPADADYTVTNRDLTPIDTTFHSPQPDYVSTEDTTFNPNESYVAAAGDAVVSQTRQTEYYGPISPAEVWQRSPIDNLSEMAELSNDVFSSDKGISDDWFDQPQVPGAATIPQAVMAAQPGKWDNPDANLAGCAFCRQGNVFYPLTYEIMGASPGLLDNPWVFSPGTTQMSSGGQVIEPVTTDGWITYPLLPARTLYQFTASLDSSFTGSQSSVVTSWRFYSAQPRTSAVPPGYGCVGSALLGVTAPCAPDPLIQLRYNAFISPADGVTADATHQIQVTPYYQDGSPEAKITSLRLWVSFNSGGRWQQVRVIAHDGSYSGSYQVPSLAATEGTVSIKAEATDSAGDTVSQTVTDGYLIAG